jgi:hypothetical protein
MKNLMVLTGKGEERVCYGALSVNEILTSKFYFKEVGCEVSTGFISFKTGSRECSS